ncbi:MAG TPA: class A beta-lactamase [Pseudonocardiaceae bacterium]|jgi:beta-lactamase class A|nr:class A beta-lactamase [Pseudonocardiaceae bacterium]
MSSSKHWILAAAVLALTSALLSGCGTSDPAATRSTITATAIPSATLSAVAQQHADQGFAQLEGQFHAHLGVYVLDTGTGRALSYQANDRFAFCSTYKALAAGILLKRDTDAQLDQVLRYRSTDLVEYSPITSQHVGTGMSLRDLITAAVRYSDNTAANLLLGQLGGPEGLQAALRGLGDPTTQVDRLEPAVNAATPGDIRDTSTADALGTDLREFVLGIVLPAGRRQQLADLLLGNTTGGPYIRAGVPAGWKVGDKTGNGGYGTRNDIAIVWPVTGAPFVVAVLSDRGTPNASSDDALIADATKTAIAAFG